MYALRSRRKDACRHVAMTSVQVKWCGRIDQILGSVTPIDTTENLAK